MWLTEGLGEAAGDEDDADGGFGFEYFGDDAGLEFLLVCGLFAEVAQMDRYQDSRE